MVLTVLDARADEKYWQVLQETYEKYDKVGATSYQRYVPAAKIKVIGQIRLENIDRRVYYPVRFEDISLY